MLYTVFYLKYLPNHTGDCVFYPEIMAGFYSGFNSLLNKPNDPGKWAYFDNAYTWFKTNALKDIVTASGRGYNTGFIQGGARRNKGDYYRNRVSNSFLATPDLSKIGYYISVDLELKKGSPLTAEEITQSKCIRKWNTVRKSYSNFTGSKYTIPPVYDYSNKKTLKNQSTNNSNNVTKKNITNTSTINVPKTGGGTRKNQDLKKIYLGNTHNKTIKK
jgi:hypothetical protein